MISHPAQAPKKLRNWSAAARQAQAERVRRQMADPVYRAKLTAGRAAWLAGVAPATPAPAASVAPEVAPAAPSIPAARTKGPSRILWNRDEIKIVAAEVARLIAVEGWSHAPQAGDRTGRAMCLDMFYAAQLLLPKERRRQRIGLAQIKADFWTAVEVALKAKSFATPPAIPPVEPPPSTAPVVVVPKEATAATLNGQSMAQTQAMATRPAPTPSGTPAADSLASAPLGVLLSATLARLLEAIGASESHARRLDHLETAHHAEMDGLMRRLVSLENGHTTTATPTTKRLPVVAIMGCQRQEFERVAEMAGRAGLNLDLRFLDQDSSPRPVHAEWVLSFKWVNHPWWVHIKSAVTDKSKRVLLGGGITSAIEQLKSWFSRPA